MSKKLASKELYERMVELRNLRTLHAAARARVTVLEAENKALRVRVYTLEEENARLRGEVTDIKYQLTELQTVLFGKKGRARKVLDEDTDRNDTTRTPRAPASYQRPVPKDEEVTETVYHRFPRDKNGNIRLRTYYIENIPLNIEKTVTKHVVEQWYDSRRRVWVSREPLPIAPVVLGDHVRVLVATLITVQRLSYEQVRVLLGTCFHLPVSDGEIAAICAGEAARLKPAEEAMLGALRTEPPPR